MTIVASAARSVSNLTFENVVPSPPIRTPYPPDSRFQPHRSSTHLRKGAVRHHGAIQDGHIRLPPLQSNSFPVTRHVAGRPLISVEGRHCRLRHTGHHYHYRVQGCRRLPRHAFHHFTIMAVDNVIPSPSVDQIRIGNWPKISSAISLPASAIC